MTAWIPDHVFDGLHFLCGGRFAIAVAVYYLGRLKHAGINLFRGLVMTYLVLEVALNAVRVLFGLTCLFDPAFVTDVNPMSGAFSGASLIGGAYAWKYFTARTMEPTP